MRHLTKILAIVIIATFTITSCSKQSKVAQQDEISQAVKDKINQLGFSTNEIQKVDEGYLVEGDIVITDADLGERPASPRLRIAEVEQYNTNNTVSVSGSSRTITVSASGSISSAFSTAINHAIDRYNAQNLTIKFSRVGSGGNINISIINTGRYIASSGFPTNSGAPYGTVKYAKKYTNYSDGFMTTVLTHEIGHCIGFRHTDYMNRSYSCGIGGNEGDGGVGANWIPGTPTGPDSASWMLACLSSTTDRPFNANDITALNYLY
ncbi:MAG: protease [Bacteroidia bacterium]|nr:protease [Bacteroidia bacterium]